MSISSLLGLGQQRFLRQPLHFPNNPRPSLLLSSCTLNTTPNPIKPHPNPSFLSTRTPNLSPLPDTRSNFKSNDGDDGGGSGSGRWGRWWWSGDESSEPEGGWLCSLPLLLVLLFVLVFEGPALARALALAGGVWEVRGGTWTWLVPDADSDSFVVVGSGKDEDHGKSTSRLESCWRQCRDLFLNLMLPEGYPDSVSSDYLQYSLWRGLQGIASQMSGVLATQVCPEEFLEKLRFQ